MRSRNKSLYAGCIVDGAPGVMPGAVFCVDFCGQNTNLTALQEPRFFSVTPYFNSGHTATQSITANGSTCVFFPNDLSNDIFEAVTTSGSGQYFQLKKIGNYRITLHVEVANNNNGLLTLEIKNSGNTTVYKSARGYTRFPIEFTMYNSNADNYYLLNLVSANAGTIYSDARYTWIEVEYMG